MNPEFKRNLILELSLQRLIAMPAILLLIFTAVGLVGAVDFIGGAGGARAVSWTAMMILIGLLVLWGTRLAADTVLGEVAARTWDGQRMSALGPWSMSWGKFAGSTVFVWFGAALCVPAFLYAGFYAGVPEVDFVALLWLLLAGLFGQSMALLASLLLQRLRPQRMRFQVTLAQLVGIGTGVAMIYLSSSWIRGEIEWYGETLEIRWFTLVSAVVFTGWSILGIYRLMRAELQFRCWPWGWTIFTLFCAVYLAGFSSDMLTRRVGVADETGTGSILRLRMAFAAAVLLSWAAAYAELKGFVRLRRWTAALSSRNLPRILDATPIWVSSFLIAVVTGLLLIAVWLALPEARDLLGIYAKLESLGAFAVATMLFLVRDIGLIYFFTLDGRARRGHVMVLVYFAALYGLIPLILSSLDLGKLLPILVPMPVGNPLLIILPVLIQVGLVGGLLVWRWQRVSKAMAADG